MYSNFNILPVATVFALSLGIIADAAIHRVPGDHATIQTAIEAAAEGDTILVEPGTYRERLRLKNGMTLRSAGDDGKGELGLRRAEAVIVDGGGNAGSDAGVTMAQGSTLDGFTVTNVGAYDDALWQKHHATQGSQQMHAHIGQPGIAGIAVDGVSCTVQNNIVHHVGYTGIAIQKPCSPRITNNICYRNMGGGIGSMQKSTALIEQNTCFQNFFAGIGHDDASPTVINNDCYENVRSGIGVSEGACPIVRNNRCFKNRRAGIATRTGLNTQPIIEDNDCFENDMPGIGTDEQAAPIIRNNRCYRNALAGIGSQDHARPIIIGNECYENGRSGIGQESDVVAVLIGNHIHHNKAAGIGFAACKAGTATLLNNRVIDNAAVAVGIGAGWNVRLSGNELSREGGMPPIVMVSKGAEAVFSNNVIRGGGVAGIRVAGKIRADANTFDGTALRRVGPPNFAVWALPGAEVVLTENVFQGWRHALSADGAQIDVINNTVRNFHATGFMIKNPTSPANAYGNSVTSANPKDKALTLDGAAGVIRDNSLKKPPQ